MSDPTSPLNEAKAKFVKAGVPFPLVPEVFESSFHCLAPRIYGTRKTLPASLYDIDAFVDEAQSSLVDEYLLIGHDGHGINSYAIHYYLVHGPLALFLQVGWGGVYMDKEKSIKWVNLQFSELERLVHTVEMYRNKIEPITRPDDRIILALSDFYGTRWRLPTEDAWREEGDAFQEAKDFLTGRHV